MIGVVILLIAVVGTAGFRYYSALDARKARIHLNAAKLTQTICDHWRGVDGDPNFSPGVVFPSGYSDLQVGSGAAGPAKPSGFTKQGNYLAVYDGVNYYITCSYKVIDPGKLRMLNVKTGWHNRGEEEGFEDADKTFSLTTYSYDDYGS